MLNLKNFKILLFITVTLFVLTSCNKDDNPGTGTVKAKINGSSITFKNITAIKASELITISAENNKKDKSLSFTIPGKISEGTYDLSDDNDAILIIYENGNSETGGYFATSGELKITNHDKNKNKLEGSFHFKGENFAGNSVEVTDGKLDIKYTEAK